MNPIKGLDLIRTNLVKLISVKEGVVTIDIDLAFNHQFAVNIEEEIRERTENLWDIKKVIVNFND